jgi:tetratricopeptide (TPR) repeat protein
MSRLVRIASWKGKTRASVVYVHGLGGHVYGTWRRTADDSTFWPLWLAQDVEGLNVFSLAYDAPASNWLGTAMPLQDRAVNILEILLSEPGLRSGPVIFICHSLGGLIVKKIILNLQQQASRRPEAADLLERVTEIVFAATPHTGSAQATWLDRLRFLAWPSSVARVLVANDPSLRDINVAYRGLADDRRSTLRHRIYYETRTTAAGEIVDEASADPGLPGNPPVPIDADHINIVKPEDRASLLYMGVRQFAELVPAGGDYGNIEVAARPVIRSDQPLNIAPKLVRVAVLALAALIAFKGVQALISPLPDTRTIQGPLIDQLAVKDRQIDRLTESLNNLRAAVAPPGAEKELKKAVTAIDEGAKVDPRYAQALELLKSGKPSEAEPLLKAVAEDKVKSAENANMDAAAAYRNLASIAAVSDPGRAREYYSRAAQLDPANVEGVIWNGWYQLEAGNRDAAQAAFERVVGTARSSNSDQVFWAQNGLGDTRMQQSDLPGALEKYRDGLAIAENFVHSNPDSSDWQRNLSTSFQRIGVIQLAQNDLQGAGKSFEDGLAIMEKLTKSDPGNSGFQRDLSTYFNGIGRVKFSQNDLPGALKSYQDGLEIADKLAKSGPGNLRWQRDLTTHLNNIGQVRWALNDMSGALRSYLDSSDLLERLVKSDPGNVGWQHDLWVALNNVGDAKAAQGDPTGALKSYRDGLAIVDKLAKSDPGNAGWRSDLAMSFNKIGGAQAMQGDIPGALKSFGNGVAVIDEAAKSDPENAERLHRVSMSFFRLGLMLKEQKETGTALEALRQGRAIMARLTEQAPQNVDWRNDLDAFDRQIRDLKS